MKYHFKTDQGIRNLPADEAAELAGSNPDYAIQDLYNAIAKGNYPSWTLYVQVTCQVSFFVLQCHFPRPIRFASPCMAHTAVYANSLLVVRSSFRPSEHAPCTRAFRCRRRPRSAETA